MADPLQDILTAQQAFSGFLGSISQLHEARVNAESSRVALEYNKSNYDYLSRFSLRIDDPRLLTAEEDSWRPEWERLQEDQEARIASIKDPVIQDQVRGKVGAAQRAFALDFQATMAQSELSLIKQNTEAGAQNAYDSGHPEIAVSIYKEAFDRGVYTEAEKRVINMEKIYPLEAEGIARKAIADATADATSKLKEGGAGVGPQVARAYDYIPKSGSQAKDAMAKSFVDAQVKAYDGQYKKQIESTAKKALESGWTAIAASNMAATSQQFRGMISPEAEQEGDSIRYEIDMLNVEAGIKDFVNGVISTAGASYDKDGKIVSGSKFIPAVQGNRILAVLQQKWSGELAGNPQLETEYNKAVADIRALMATGQDAKNLADTAMNNALVRYNVGAISGEGLMSTLVEHIDGFSFSEFSKMLEDIKAGDYQDDSVRAVLQDPKAWFDFLKDVKSEKLIDKETRASMERAIEGKFSSDMDTAWRDVAMKEAMEIFKKETIKGTISDYSAVRKAYVDRMIRFQQDYDAGKYERIRQGLSDKSVNERLGVVVNGLADGSENIFGVPVTETSKAEALEWARPIAFATVAAAEQKQGSPMDTSITTLRMLPGADKHYYFIGTDIRSPGKGWQKTCYKMEGNASGLVLVRYTMDGGTAKDMEKAIELGDFSKLRRQESYSAASLLYTKDSFTDKTLKAWATQADQDAQTRSESRLESGAVK